MELSEQKNIKILIVDDHAAARDLIKTILKGAGFKFIEMADCGSAAIARIRDNFFDLVICDWNMPDLSGLEVLKAVREDSRTQKMPFLMLTAEAYKENVVAANQLGVSEYIVKPFTAEVLLSKLEKVLSKL